MTVLRLRVTLGNQKPALPSAMALNDSAAQGNPRFINAVTNPTPPIVVKHIAMVDLSARRPASVSGKSIAAEKPTHAR